MDYDYKKKSIAVLEYGQSKGNFATLPDGLEVSSPVIGLSVLLKTPWPSIRLRCRLAKSQNRLHFVALAIA